MAKVSPSRSLLKEKRILHVSLSVRLVRGCPERVYLSTTQVLRYQNRISGPLLDRNDIHIVVPRVEHEKLASDRLGEPSETIRGRVEKARYSGRGSAWTQMGARRKCRPMRTWVRQRCGSIAS